MIRSEESVIDLSSLLADSTLLDDPVLYVVLVGYGDELRGNMSVEIVVDNVANLLRKTEKRGCDLASW